jgi:CDP-paratose 2-epimerase
VTTSLDRPFDDFEVNARGTLNVLVYGALNEVPLTQEATRYVPVDARVRQHGIDERQALAFHSPYGCSKGAADQYVLDYAKTFGLHAVVLRMSCIYGPHQCGNEDQGWVAHFIAQSLAGRGLAIYGDGRQVRDVLFVSDLVNALIAAQANAAGLAGQAFNMGGGPERTISLLELVDLVYRLAHRRVACQFAPWRAADQRFYVSDSRRFQSATGWRPTVSVTHGVSRLLTWLLRERPDLTTATAAAS